MKHIIIAGFLVLTSVVPCISQKVKYKDLFILLSAENYSDGDRYLRAFLLEEPDHPHANYYMGRMLQSYMEEEDILKSSDRIIELADSSSRYLNKALNLTTEKYVKKKDDYYAEFQRRDMRTAKFSIKLSDVHLDMESRMKVINDYKTAVSQLSVHFDIAVNYYDSTLYYYEQIKEKSASTNALYFNSGPDEFKVYRSMASCYDSSLYNFNRFQTLIKEVGKNNDAQKLVIKPIESYPLTNIVKPDFYAQTVEFWNFKEWSTGIEDVILKQIYPLKKRMISFDEKLYDLFERIVNDSLDARPEVFRLATENVARDLVDYDKLSLPAAIYDIRIAEINYHSAINYWYNVVADTMHVGLKLDVLNSMQSQQRGNAKLLKRLVAANNELERAVFKDYIAERYQDESGLTAFIESQSNDVKNDSILLYTWFTEVRDQDNFTYWHEESIALKIGEQIDNNDSIKYSTFIVEEKSERVYGFYAWMEKAQSVSLSFGISPSSRLLDTLYTAQISPEVIEGRDLHDLQFISDSIATDERIWVLNSTESVEDSTYQIQVITTDLNGGIGWSKEFSVSEMPKEVKFDATNQSIILIDSKEEPILVLNEDGEEVPPSGGPSEEDPQEN